MQDPLTVLGEDIFVEVLSNLGVNDLCSSERVTKSWLACARAHSSGLWRHASLADGVEPFDLQTCNNLAKNGIWGIDEYDRRPIAFNVYRLLETPATAMRELPEWDWSDVAHDADPMENKGNVDGKRRTRVNWRYVCELTIASSIGARTDSLRRRSAPQPSECVESRPMSASVDHASDQHRVAYQVDLGAGHSPVHITPDTSQRSHHGRSAHVASHLLHRGT